MDELLSDQLYNQIETELEFCESSTTPLVCAQLEDAESRAAIIKTIAETCVSGRMDISTAIAEVERLYSNNDID